MAGLDRKVQRKLPEDYKDTMPSNPVFFGVSSHPLVWLLIEGGAVTEPHPFFFERKSLILRKTITTMHNTSAQYDQVIARCRDLFVNKMKDYGPAWRILRPCSLTDQIFIKAKRIRTLEINGESKVGEGIWPEFVGIINYGVIGLIQLELGYSDVIDISRERALELYDHHIGETKRLMLAKNTDYGEAWRDMRTSSYTDLILSKIQRTKEIENHDGRTLVSEGIAANYQDMINYAVFAMIKHDEAQNN